MQAEAIVRIDFYAPGPEPGLVDAVFVRCLAGFRRLRPIDWALSIIQFVEDGESAPTRLSPLDPEVELSEPPLLKAFCSQPTPVVKRIKIDPGYAQDILVGDDCGETSKLDCVMGEVLRGAKLQARPGDSEIVTWQRVRMPAKWLVFDMVVHRSIPNLDQITLKMRSDLQGEFIRALPSDHPAWLPVYDPIMSYGSGRSFPPVPEYQQYSALLEFVFSRLGWDDREFRLYRLRMKYPPISTSIGAAWPLPRST